MKTLPCEVTVLKRRRLLVVVAACVLALGAIGYVWRRPIGYTVLFHLGRSRACTWEDVARKLDRRDIEAAIKAACELVRADPAGYELWRTPKGELWIPAGNGKSLPHFLAVMDQETYQSDSCAVRAGDVVIDCGAHIGLFTREALAAGAKLVVAVEPVPENIECLARNLAGEIRASRVVVCPKGVWEKSGTLSFAIRPTFSAGDGVVLEPKDMRNIERLPVTTIDELAAELGLDRVDFIKLHVEGSERQAIEGARATIAKFRPRLAVATDHRDDDAERIPEAVRAIRPGYRQECSACYVSARRLLILPSVLLFHEEER